MTRTWTTILSLALFACGARSTEVTGGGGDDDDSRDGGHEDDGGTIEDAGAPNDCAGLGEAACIAARPTCVPRYDDSCCPQCQPVGRCADCADWQFFDCLPFDGSECIPGFEDVCGTTPSWACTGGEAACEPPNESVPSLCGGVPGCVLATPDPFACPTCVAECHPVRADTCESPECDHIPASCAGEGVVENHAGCDTGYCVPDRVCGAASEI